MPTMKKITLYWGLLFLISVGSILLNMQHFSFLSTTAESSTVATSAFAAKSTHTLPDADPLTLTYGDLPGYTGWARPIQSTAAWYTIAPVPPAVATVGEPFTWTLSCHSPCPLNLSALFDTRAYGPSILPGKVERHPSGNSYTVTVNFLDSGTYVVEIVLAFSNVPPLTSFPLTFTFDEPLYEGYLLPGAPFSVQVVHKQGEVNTTRTGQHSCGAPELYESTTTSALSKARWKVTSRTRDTGAVPNPGLNASYEEYRRGPGSIGFTADYVYMACRLTSLNLLVEQSNALPYRNQHVIVFIGDSHMRKQYNLFLEYFGGSFESIYVKTNDGLSTRFLEITKALDKLKKMQQERGAQKQIHVLFNAGLHEIAILCSQRRVRSRGRIINVPDEAFSCTQQYEVDLTKLIKLVRGLPNASVVFQSTSAGWLKWGNYGFGWEPNRTQEYPFDSHACADFNDVAFKVMDQHDIPVMDSFWLTVARPDHRQIDPFNSRGKKLVHSGVEIYEVLLRKWMSIVLED